MLRGVHGGARPRGGRRSELRRRGGDRRALVTSVGSSLTSRAGRGAGGRGADARRRISSGPPTDRPYGSCDGRPFDAGSPARSSNASTGSPRSRRPGPGWVSVGTRPSRPDAPSRHSSGAQSRRTPRRRGRATDLEAPASGTSSASTSSSRLVSLSEASSQKKRPRARSAAIRSRSPPSSPVDTSVMASQSRVAAGRSRRQITSEE